MPIPASPSGLWPRSPRATRAEFLHNSLAGYEEKGTKIELRGTEKIGDQDCCKILVTLSDGFRNTCSSAATAF
jgi:hypothetical protein